MYPNYLKSKSISENLLDSNKRRSYRMMYSYSFRTFQNNFIIFVNFPADFPFFFKPQPSYLSKIEISNSEWTKFMISLRRVH